MRKVFIGQLRTHLQVSPQFKHGRWSKLCPLPLLCLSTLCGGGPFFHEAPVRAVRTASARRWAAWRSSGRLGIGTPAPAFAARSGQSAVGSRRRNVGCVHLVNSEQRDRQKERERESERERERGRERERERGERERDIAWDQGSLVGRQTSRYMGK